MFTPFVLNTCLIFLKKKKSLFIKIQNPLFSQNPNFENYVPYLALCKTHLSGKDILSQLFCFSLQFVNLILKWFCGYKYSTVYVCIWCGGHKTCVVFTGKLGILCLCHVVFIWSQVDNWCGVSFSILVHRMFPICRLIYLFQMSSITWFCEAGSLVCAALWGPRGYPGK